ncbi:lipid A deacylase LpxR family protein [Agarilytica rhodophyticola]|uniref:lipid A deacylase LpxR family protein n=1 Tax=Agarilytica rhodophyticola TaxID=1737490 RepID=UPI000B348395|nr:lipid A deacylase LpxR family protein [Agarilytica rhodophyticola]
MTINLSKRTLLSTLFSLSLLVSSQSWAKIEESDVSKPHSKSIVNSHGAKQGWAVAFDNDVLVPGSRDQDYTYGVNVTLAGDKTKDHWASLHQPLSWLDSKFQIKHDDNALASHKIEYGLFGFTPEDIGQAAPAFDDRPYASLIYVSSTTEHYNPQSETSWSSTLTVGALGLGIVGELQESVHDLTSGDQPLGWNNQISDGGELTARYSIARQQLLLKTSSGAELKNTLQASVGYITEVSWSLGGRIGKIHTPWVSFNPELISYGEKSAPTSSTHVYEHYLWGGVAIKGRAYNAFLQGQFRDSAVEYDTGEVNHAILEGWLGYTLALTNGYRFTYSLRAHTSEIKDGRGDRNVIWGGLQLAKSFD